MKLAAGVWVVNDEKKILAFKQNLRGLGLPCGSVDDGETTFHAAIRECLEETGLVVQLDPNKPFVYQEKQTLVTIYKVYEYSGELKPELGVGTPMWVSLDELKAGPYGTFNAKCAAHFETGCMGGEVYHPDLDHRFKKLTMTKVEDSNTCHYCQSTRNDDGTVTPSDRLRTAMLCREELRE